MEYAGNVTTVTEKDKKPHLKHPGCFKDSCMGYFLVQVWLLSLWFKGSLADHQVGSALVYLCWEWTLSQAFIFLPKLCLSVGSPTLPVLPCFSGVSHKLLCWGNHIVGRWELFDVMAALQKKSKKGLSRCVFSKHVQVPLYYNTCIPMFSVATGLTGVAHLIYWASCV